MKRGSSILLVLLVALGGWAGWWWFQTSPPGTATATATVPSRSVKPQRAQTDVAGLDGVPVQGQISKEDEPIARVLETAEPLPGVLPPDELAALLLPRARSGDARAGCRLAVELVYCRGALQWTPQSKEEIVRREEAMRKAGGTDLTIEQARFHSESRNLARERCLKLPKDLRDQAPFLFLAAAQRGHVASAVAFARGEGIGGEEIVANPELYALYRRHGLQMFEQALHAGSVDLVQSWLHALRSNGVQFMSGLLPPHYQDVRIPMGLLVEVQAGMPLPRPAAGQGFSMEATPAVRQQVQDLFRKHFEGSKELQAARQRVLREEERQKSRNVELALLGQTEVERAQAANERCTEP